MEGLTSSNTFKVRIKFNQDIAKFLFQFIIFLSSLYFISITFESMIPIFNMQTTTKTLFFIVKILGLGGMIKGNQIVFPSFVLQIIRQCTGIFEVIGLSACILSYPASMKKKMFGLAAGISSIYVFNITRLVLLAFLGVYYPFVFEILHEYLLQLTFVFFVVFSFLFWIDRV